MIGTAILLLGLAAFLTLLAVAEIDLPDSLMILGGLCILISVPLVSCGLAQLAWRYLP